MNFIKKQSIGFYLATITILIAIMGIIFYIKNCNTNYFRKTGMNIWVIVCMIIAVMLEVATIILSQRYETNSYLDAIMIIAPMLFIAAFMIFLSSRVNSIASILSFERNAETMADLSSAIIGMGCCLFAVIFSIASSFFDIIRE